MLVIKRSHWPQYLWETIIGHQKHNRGALCSAKRSLHRNIQRKKLSFHQMQSEILKKIGWGTLNLMGTLTLANKSAEIIIGILILSNIGSDWNRRIRTWIKWARFSITNNRITNTPKRRSYKRTKRIGKTLTMIHLDSLKIWRK
jgi:hypothetical protein